MSNTNKCKRCGIGLSPDGVYPCWYCINKALEFEGTCEDIIYCEESTVVGSKQPETGRFADFSNTTNPCGTQHIELLIKKFISGDTDPFERFINDLVKNFHSYIKSEITFYRGVPKSKLNSEKKIGPSPTPSEGRYNEKDEKAIYLIENILFLPKEIQATDEMAVQEYRIPLGDMEVADLSSENINMDNKLALLFQMVERGKTLSGFNFEDELEKAGKSKYLLSQTIAKAFKNNGWQGLYVPGVHGTQGKNYRNLSLFGKCVDCWEQWTVGEYKLLSIKNEF